MERITKSTAAKDMTSSKIKSVLKQASVHWDDGNDTYNQQGKGLEQRPTTNTPSKWDRHNRERHGSNQSRVEDKAENSTRPSSSHSAHRPARPAEGYVGERWPSPHRHVSLIARHGHGSGRTSSGLSRFYHHHIGGPLKEKVDRKNHESLAIQPARVSNIFSSRQNDHSSVANKKGNPGDLRLIERTNTC